MEVFGLGMLIIFDITRLSDYRSQERRAELCSTRQLRAAVPTNAKILFLQMEEEEENADENDRCQQKTKK
jgi:hypothetical protein